MYSVRPLERTALHTRLMSAPVRPGFALLLVAASLLALRLPILLAGPSAQLSLMSDDAGYYLEAARRMVETGAWPSMDGRNPTSGFHPLYFLLLVGLQWVAGTRPEVVIPLVMGIQQALNAAAAWCLCRYALRTSPHMAMLLATLMFAVSPGWLSHGLVGVENGLSSFLLLLFVLRADRRFGREGGSARPGLQGWLVDGFLLGLAIAARTDSGIFAMCYVLWVALRCAKVRQPGWVPGIALACTVAMLTLAPWWIACWIRLGSLGQDSAVALAARFAKESGPLGSLRWWAITATDVGFWLYRLLWTWGLLPLTAWLCGLAVRSDRFRRWGTAHWIHWMLPLLCLAPLLLRANDPAAIRSVKTAALELGLSAIGFSGGLLSSRKPQPRPGSMQTMLWIYALAVVLAYSVGFHGFQPWYTTGPALIVVAWITLPILANWLQGHPKSAVVLLFLCTLHGALADRDYLRRGARNGMSYHVLEDGRDLRMKLDKAVRQSRQPLRFGSFDSGQLSYRVHPFPISNLDGVMNHAAAVALRHVALREYLKSDGITHVIGDSGRIAEFAAISPFRVVRDPSLTAQLGTPIWKVME